MAGRTRQEWPEEVKRRIVAETYTHGTSVAAVALSHAVNANLMYISRRIPASTGRRYPAPALLPVEITPDLDILQSPIKVQASGSVANEHKEPPSIEIALPCGVRLGRRGGVDAAALSDLLRALKTA